ncbi:MAG: hypothetical protein K5945_08520, partial [Bacteroidaceae bacterium]|nr:hypothetical protein [Bacteroidaceae bacterium]
GVQSQLYGGIVGNNVGTCQDCLAVGAHVAVVQLYNGAIAGYREKNATMWNNYYYDCTVGTATKNIGVTVLDWSNATTDTDGARGLYALALPDGIAAVRTATATLPGTGNATYADGADIAGNAYYVSGATVTISGAPSGTSGGISYATDYIVSYNDGEDHTDRYPADAQGNATFTMPAAAAIVSCETTPSLDGRTLYKDDKWNTLCLPFSLTTAQIAASPLAGCTLMALDGAQSDLTNGTLTLTFTEATSITAGTPYIIKWAAGGNIVAPAFTGVTIDQTMRNVATRDGKVTFKGTDDYLRFDAENKNILFLGGDDKLYYPQNGASIGACCAYFEVADGSSVKAFKLNIGGDETSIENVQWSMGRSASLYDLNGRKLQGKPSQKGIYIKDGKKVVVE